MFTIAEATPGHYHSIAHKATPKLVLFVVVPNVPAVHGFTCFVDEKKVVERSVEAAVDPVELRVETVMIALAALILHGACGIPHVCGDREKVSGVIITQSLGGVGVVLRMLLLALAHDVLILLMNAMLLSRENHVEIVNE